MKHRNHRYIEPEDHETRPGSVEMRRTAAASNENRVDPVSQKVKVEDLGTVRLDRILEIRSALRSGSYNEETRLAALFQAFEDEVAGMFAPNGGLENIEREG